MSDEDEPVGEDWRDALEQFLRRHDNRLVLDDADWSAIRDTRRRGGIQTQLSLRFPTEVPINDVLDPLMLVDRAFRYATRAAEEGVPVTQLMRRRSRPIGTKDGLVLRDVEKGSACFYLDASTKIYQALTSQPASFILNVVTILSLLGIPVVIKFGVGGRRNTETVIEPQLPDEEVAGVSSPQVVYNGPVLVFNLGEGSVGMENVSLQDARNQLPPPPPPPRELQ